MVLDRRFIRCQTFSAGLPQLASLCESDSFLSLLQYSLFPLCSITFLFSWNGRKLVLVNFDNTEIVTLWCQVPRTQALACHREHQLNFRWRLRLVGVFKFRVQFVQMFHKLARAGPLCTWFTSIWSVVQSLSHGVNTIMCTSRCLFDLSFYTNHIVDGKCFFEIRHLQCSTEMRCNQLISCPRKMHQKLWVF